MRVTSPQELLATPLPSELRPGSKIASAYIGVRTGILEGRYRPGQILLPRQIEEDYGTSNTSVQLILMRLAIEGLVKILPIRERSNASFNEYRTADLSMRDRMLSDRRGDFVEDISKGGYPAYKETLILKIQYADTEIAKLLHIEEGEQIVYHRNLQKRDGDTIVCINDTYLPFWFAPLMPELEKPDSDIYQLMRRLGKKPFWCRETVDVVQATAVERFMFGLSLDDPAPMLKILRRSLDEEGNPLEMQFLTDRGDTYRLDYSFPLYSSGIPEVVRGQ
jgi:hypothetical protein